MMKAFYKKIFYRMFKPMQRGRLDIDLPDGSLWTFGHEDTTEIRARMTIRDENFFRRCFLFGDIGFAESYISGEWQADDLNQVIAWMILNIEHHPTLTDERRKRRPVNVLAAVNRVYHALRPNNFKGSRKNIADHYDLSNQFFELLLDPTMTYSSAYFQGGGETLEEAQIKKYDVLCQKMRISPRDSVLEIGSGWGGFAVYAAKVYGCQVTTITVSQMQFDYVIRLIQKLKLNDQVKVRLLDYRHIKGLFDKIVSIEMIEAVGFEYMRVYFQQCHRLLKKDGLLGLQMILAPDHRFDSFRKIPDFIQKHIFPGSLLPSIDVVQKNLRQTGTLCLLDFEDITPSYVRTLTLWKKNFQERLADVRAMGFDGEFIRKWNYYFSYCAAAFAMRNISVAQAVFSRPNNLSLTE